MPVLLAGDIDRGGVIASLVGTHAVLEADERALIKGFLINKFRGDLRLFDGGLRAIEERTGWPSLGVAPWFADAHRLPAEDALDLASGRSSGDKLVITCPILARIANFDDLDPLAQEPAVDLRFVPPGEPLPADADVVLLPGSKSTIGDLAFLRAQGWDIDILAHVRRGGHVVGLCGGYQMLGRSVSDPRGLEGPAGGSMAGLGLLEVDTILADEKIVRPVEGRDLASGEAIAGYEIHLGRTEDRIARGRCSISAAAWTERGAPMAGSPEATCMACSRPMASAGPGSRASVAPPRSPTRPGWKGRSTRWRTIASSIWTWRASSP